VITPSQKHPATRRVFRAARSERSGADPVASVAVVDVVAVVGDGAGGAFVADHADDVVADDVARVRGAGEDESEGEDGGGEAGGGAMLHALRPLLCACGPCRGDAPRPASVAPLPHAALRGGGSRLRRPGVGCRAAVRGEGVDPVESPHPDFPPRAGEGDKRREVHASSPSLVRGTVRGRGGELGPRLREDDVVLSLYFPTGRR